MTMIIAPPDTWTPLPVCRIIARLAPLIPFKRTPKFNALIIERATQIVFGHKGHIPETGVTTEDLVEDLDYRHRRPVQVPPFVWTKRQAIHN